MANKFLDLSVYAEQTFDVKFPNGEMWQLKKPTQALVISMVSIGNMDNTPQNQGELLKAVTRLCAQILSNNNKGKSISYEEVANELDIGMIMAIVKGYSDFTEELQANPI